MLMFSKNGIGCSLFLYSKRLLNKMSNKLYVKFYYDFSSLCAKLGLADGAQLFFYNDFECVS